MLHKIRSAVPTRHPPTCGKGGRSFVRRMIDLSTTRRHINATLRINREFRSDLEWWFQLSAEWNGTSILAPIRAESPDAQITSDASGSWGCGAFYEGKWFQLQWDQFSAPHHITVKELLPIIIGAAVWGQEWTGKTIRARCDNMAAVHILRTRQSKDPESMHLVSPTQTPPQFPLHSTRSSSPASQTGLPEPGRLCSGLLSPGSRPYHCKNLQLC